MKVTELEMQLQRVFFSFSHWQEECEKCINDINFSANELVILHMIRMRDNPKTIEDIGIFLNRSDNHNTHYSVKKLFKLGLIVKKKTRQNKKSFSFQITEAGIQNTNTYANIRKNILIKMFNERLDLNLDEIDKMKRI